MKHSPLRPLRTLFCAALFAGALAVPALAADSAITVRVDDQTVAFSDARPLLRGDRTYVPFRAIFEQMDASVSWDDATQTVTATRDGRDVRFQIGDTEIVVTEDGQTRTVSTDAAPFVEGGRTYVPVRFASEAFGACVDWVQSSQTVLIVDVDALVDDSYAASFAQMDAYLDFTAPDSTRTLAGDFAFDMQYKAAMGSLPVSLHGTVSGCADDAAAQLSGAVQTDVQALQDAVEQNEGAEVIDSEIQDLLQTLADASYQAIVSRADGKLYLSGALATELGAAEGGWLALPFDALAGDALGGLLAAPAEASFADYAAALAQQTDLKTAPDATVQTVRAVLERLKTNYGDRAFAVSGQQAVLHTDGYTLTLIHGADGAVTRAQLTGTAQQDGIAYTAQIDQEADRYTLTLTVQGGRASDFSLKTTLSSAAGGDAPSVRPADGDITAWQ